MLRGQYNFKRVRINKIKTKQKTVENAVNTAIQYFAELLRLLLAHAGVLVLLTCIHTKFSRIFSQIAELEVFEMEFLWLR